ncbi:hypothetical protein AAZX31_11G229500 [Glycine max]
MWLKENHITHFWKINSQSLKPMIRDLSSMLRNTQWRATITHLHREAISCANYLANLGHDSDSFMTIVNFVPAFFSHACLG